MKKPVIIILCLIGVLLLMCSCNSTKIPTQGQTVFVWNDVPESIPADGSMVMIEFTKGDTIYLAPISEEGIVIDLPEEIGEAQDGDRLWVEGVSETETTKTITITFAP